METSMVTLSESERAAAEAVFGERLAPGGALRAASGNDRY